MGKTQLLSVREHPITNRVRVRLLSFIKSHQPFRFIARSFRNLFLPQDPTHDGPQAFINIEISSICDAKCVFCSYKLGLRQRKQASLDWFQSVARSAVSCGYKRLDLTPLTGELFTHKDAIEIIRIASLAGFERIETYTNAINLYKFDIEALLSSGIDQINISTPGFSEDLYKNVFGVNKFAEFRDSVERLLEIHGRLSSRVDIVFELRGPAPLRAVEHSAFYRAVIRNSLSEKIRITEALTSFDSWGGLVTQKDLTDGLTLDWNPIKSLAPLKSVYPCAHLYEIGILANGDVRLCNCRYDSSIESEMDPLWIGALNKQPDLSRFLKANKKKIERIRNDFRNGALPSLCKNCRLYYPVRADSIVTPEMQAGS